MEREGTFLDVRRDGEGVGKGNDVYHDGGRLGKRNRKRYSREYFPGQLLLLLCEGSQHGDHGDETWPC